MAQASDNSTLTHSPVSQVGQNYLVSEALSLLLGLTVRTSVLSG